MAKTLAIIAGTVCLLAAANAQDAGTVTGAATIGTMEDTFTMPLSNFTDTESGCTTLMQGCTGTFVTIAHEVAGTVTVQDDCTFFVDGWQFDGLGPAVEWWAAKQSAEAPAGEFPYDPQYMSNPIKIGELGAEGSYQTGSLHDGDSEIVVRLGKDAAGEQLLLSEELNHISVWCEDFAVDFGNAALDCDAAAPGTASAPASVIPTATTGVAGAPTETGGGVVPNVEVNENASDEVPTTEDVLGDNGSTDVAIPGEEETSGAGLFREVAAAALTCGAALVAWLL